MCEELKNKVNKKGRRAGTKIDYVKAFYNTLLDSNFPGEFIMEDDKTITWKYSHDNAFNDKDFKYTKKIIKICMPNDRDFTIVSENHTPTFSTIQVKYKKRSKKLNIKSVSKLPLKTLLAIIKKEEKDKFNINYYKGLDRSVLINKCKRLLLERNGVSGI